MKQYVDLCVATRDQEATEIVTALLADLPFECFETTSHSDERVDLHAYIPIEAWRECCAEARSLVADFGAVVSEDIIEDENWNARWEAESFEPVDIDGRMVIRAPHHPAPDHESVIDVVITPQMSFGSGHHHTTRMMCRAIMRLTPPQARILDMGCGTGVLSIAALKCGASEAHAVDIDVWSVESARQAAALNNLEERMKVILGSAEEAESLQSDYDMILANINRNIITSQMGYYAKSLRHGGVLLLSGFLTEDIAIIKTEAERNHICITATQEEQGWICLECQKL